MLKILVKSLSLCLSVQIYTFFAYHGCYFSVKSFVLKKIEDPHYHIRLDLSISMSVNYP